MTIKRFKSSVAQLRNMTKNMEYAANWYSLFLERNKLTDTG